jgi:hypothetical protein
MAHFAKVENGIVTEVIVAEQEFIDSGRVGDPSLWYKTSYNTRRGVYYTPNTSDPDPDQSKAFRKIYAAIGFTYDSERDAFIQPKDHNGWVLDEDSCTWKAPKPIPDPEKLYYWDDEALDWVLIM